MEATLGLVSTETSGFAASLGAKTCALYLRLFQLGCCAPIEARGARALEVSLYSSFDDWRCSSFPQSISLDVSMLPCMVTPYFLFKETRHSWYGMSFVGGRC